MRRSSFTGYAMRAALFLTACVIGLSAPVAQAQVIILGDTSATSCYQAAEFGTMGMRDGFEVCTQALNVPNLSLRDKAGTYVNRAVIRLMAGDYQGALADTNSSIRMLSSLGEAYVNRGAALLNLGRPAEALTDIMTGMQLGTAKEHLVLYNRAAARELTGDFRGAYYDYRRSAELRPDFLLAKEQLMRFQVTRREAKAGDSDDMMRDGMVEEVVALTKLQDRTSR